MISEASKVGDRRSLTTGQVAVLCAVSIGAVKKWIKQGKMSASRTPGGHFRVASDEFERFRGTYRFPPGVPAEPRILVVDDDPVAVQTILDNLRAIRPQPRLDSALNWYDGLIKVGIFRPDVLVLCIDLPGLDAFEVCRRIKAEAATRRTRIVMITHDPAGATRERAFQAGADVFLAKPLGLHELTAQTRLLLQRG